MANSIKIGDPIPNFSIKDSEGIEIKSDDLLGSPFVIYFYPKDDTPGCTTQACSFRDHLNLFNDLNTLVIGVSADNADSHHDFIRKNHLNFTLLCDEQMTLARLFGATQEKESGGKKTLSILRSTFVIDAAGIVRWIEKPVSIDGHSERVLNAVKQLVT